MIKKKLGIASFLLIMSGCIIPPPPNHVPISPTNQPNAVVNYPKLTPEAKREIDAVFPHDSLPHISSWIGNVVEFEQGLQSIIGFL